MPHTQRRQYQVRRLASTPAVDCPCGVARRMFSRDDDTLLGVHRVTIAADARKHYHKDTTEYYIILEGEGELELDEDVVPVKPGDVVMIPPYTRHAARGALEIINVVYPPLDPSDEYFDE